MGYKTCPFSSQLEARTKCSTRCLGSLVLLHHCLIVEDKFLSQLRPVQPIVPPLELRAKKCRIVVAVYRNSGQKKSVTCPAGTAENRRNAVVEAKIGQAVFKETLEVLVLFGERERVGEGVNCNAKLLFDDFLRMSHFVLELIRSQRS